VYAGGRFTVIGGQFRNYVAALAAGNGLATSWNPWADGEVMAIAVQSPLVYFGGDFTTLGGQFRDRIAAVDGTGSPTVWNPGADGVVRTLLLKGAALYAGGAFNQLAGQPRPHLGAVLLATGQATSWNPAPRQEVLALAQNPTTIVAGGSFQSLAETAHSFLAGFDATTALDVPPVPGPTVSGLEGVTPNPAVGPVTIAFTLRQPSWVRVRVHDLMGREVARPVDEARPAGRSEVTWRPAVGSSAIPAGVYFLRYEAEGSTTSRRLVLLR